MANSEYVLELKGITKIFPGLKLWTMFISS